MVVAFAVLRLDTTVLHEETAGCASVASLHTIQFIQRSTMDINVDSIVKVKPRSSISFK